MGSLRRFGPVLLLTACSGAASSAIDPGSSPDPTAAPIPAEAPPGTPDASLAPEDGSTPTMDAKPPKDAPYHPPPDASEPDTYVPPPPTCMQRCVSAAQQCAPLKADTSCSCGACPNANETCSIQNDPSYGSCGTCTEQANEQCYKVEQPFGFNKHQYEPTCPYLPSSQPCVTGTIDGKLVKCCKDP